MRARPSRLDCLHVPEPPRDPPELTRAREALIHSLANGVTIMTTNLTALRMMQLGPEAKAIMDDMAIAAERVIRNFEALRKLA
jgi:hypothetical protein